MFQIPAECSRLFDVATAIGNKPPYWFQIPAEGSRLFDEHFELYCGGQAIPFQIPAEGSRLFDLPHLPAHRGVLSVSNPSGVQPSLRRRSSRRAMPLRTGFKSQRSAAVTSTSSIMNLKRVSWVVSIPSGAQPSLRRIGEEIKHYRLCSFKSQRSAAVSSTWHVAHPRYSLICFKSQRSAAVSSTYADLPAPDTPPRVSNPSGAQPSLRLCLKPA